MKRLFIFTAAVFTLAACGPVASTAQELAGGGSKSCSEPPLQCDGNPANRAVYPGCDAYCKDDETAFCLSGDCFFRRAPSCTCAGSYLPPGK